MTILGKKPAWVILKDRLEPPTICSLVCVTAVFITSLLDIVDRMSNTSSTETPASINVPIVLQNVATNAWLNILPIKGSVSASLLKK